MSEASEVTHQHAARAPSPDRAGRSRSLVGAAAALAGLLVLAVVHYGPGLLAPDPGVARLAPTIFQPAAGSRGVHDLGGGVTASVFLSGLRVDVDGRPVLKTTERAAPVAVLDGRLRESADGPVEEPNAEQRSLTVDEAVASAGRVTWAGVASMSDGTRVRLALTVTAQGADRFSLAVSAEQPVDGFAVALDPRFTDVVAPPGDARRVWAWWSDDRPGLVAARVRGELSHGAWGLEVTGGRVAVDRRTDGATFLHVWGASPTLTFTAPTVGS